MRAGKRADVKRRDVDKAAAAARASARRKLKVRRTLAFHIVLDLDYEFLQSTMFK